MNYMIHSFAPFSISLKAALVGVIKAVLHNIFAVEEMNMRPAELVISVKQTTTTNHIVTCVSFFIQNIYFIDDCDDLLIHLIVDTTIRIHGVDDVYGLIAYTTVPCLIRNKTHL